MARIRTRLPAAFGLVSLAALPASPASAEIRLAPNVVVLSPVDVLSHHVTVEDGVDWVSIPGHERWALAAADHPSYATHTPIDPETAARAWRAIDAAFRTRIRLTIVCLPRPRTALPNSSAEDNVIYLSPGAEPYDVEQVCFLLAHEMGHCVHRELLPDDDLQGWRAYRRVRSIEDESRYHDWATHADRPREIFAEDFRYLFGGRLANYSGNIENTDLPLPDRVPGLAAFMLGLAGESAEAPSADAWDIAALRPVPRLPVAPSRWRAIPAG